VKLDYREIECVRKYLVAYAKIMWKKKFRFAYIDAFAGTGYNVTKSKQRDDAPLFPELSSIEAAEFRDGSARIALRVEPRFTKYIFIEKSPDRFAELNKLKEGFPRWLRISCSLMLTPTRTCGTLRESSLGQESGCAFP